MARCEKVPLPEPVSRSQKKRDSSALQDLGKKLAALSNAGRAKLPLPPELARALAQYHTITGHEAARRQLQYIGRLMREAASDGSLADVLLRAFPNAKQCPLSPAMPSRKNSD